MKEVTVEELKAKKEAGEDFYLLDVREDFEYMVSNLDGTHIALGEVENRIEEIKSNKDKEIIVMCRSGGRSSRVVALLEREGLTEVYNLKGGITAWSKEIDPSIPVA